MADVSYDVIARHPDFNLYFESTQEPTAAEPITPSRELEPPPREQPKIESTYSSSTRSAIASANAINQEINALPFLKDPFYSFLNTTAKSRLNEIAAPLKNPVTKAANTAIELKSRGLTISFPEMKNVIRDQRAPAANKTQNKQEKTQQKITSPKNNANLVKLAPNKSNTNETLSKNNQTATKKVATTTEKSVVSSTTKSEADNFADTIFREDFPTPAAAATNEPTTEKSEVKTTPKQPAKGAVNEVKAIHASKITKLITVKPASAPVLRETSTLKSPSITHLVEEVQTAGKVTKTPTPTFKPVTTFPKETSTFKPQIPSTKRKPSPKWNPIGVANDGSHNQGVTKSPDANADRPTFASTTKRPLTIFELLDKFKPLSFRTSRKLTQKTIVKRSSPEESPPKTIKTNLFKNLPGNPARIVENKMENRMHILKEIKNDPVFKNFVQAQRYRMVQVTLPPIKKVHRHHDDSIKHVHIKHTIHQPPYNPPATTEPSAYADHLSVKKYRVTY